MESHKQQDDITLNLDMYWSNVLTECFSIPYKNLTMEDTSFDLSLYTIENIMWSYLKIWNEKNKFLNDKTTLFHLCHL